MLKSTGMPVCIYCLQNIVAFFILHVCVADPFQNIDDLIIFYGTRMRTGTRGHGSRTVYVD